MSRAAVQLTMTYMLVRVTGQNGAICYQNSSGERPAERDTQTDRQVTIRSWTTTENSCSTSAAPHQVIQTNSSSQQCQYFTSWLSGGLHAGNVVVGSVRRCLVVPVWQPRWDRTVSCWALYWFWWLVIGGFWPDGCGRLLTERPHVAFLHHKMAEADSLSSAVNHCLTPERSGRRPDAMMS